MLMADVCLLHTLLVSCQLCKTLRDLGRDSRGHFHDVERSTPGLSAQAACNHLLQLRAGTSDWGLLLLGRHARLLAAGIRLRYDTGSACEAQRKRSLWGDPQQQSLASTGSICLYCWPKGLVATVFVSCLATACLRHRIAHSSSGT